LRSATTQETVDIVHIEKSWRACISGAAQRLENGDQALVSQAALESVPEFLSMLQEGRHQLRIALAVGKVG
jgi:hypothetical protein